MPPSLKELAIKYLRSKIADGSFPPGSKISDFAVSRDVGISRTPIREAINQLASEGLLEMSPGSGACVRTVSPRDLEELYEIREVLESHAAFKAAQNATPELVAALGDRLSKIEGVRDSLKPGTKILDEKTTATQREYDLEFHRLIIRAAGNSRLEKIIQDSRILSQLFGIMEKRMPVSYLLDACKFHSRILRAVEAKKPEEAGRAMREHVQSALRLARRSASRKRPSQVPEALAEFLDE